MSQTLQWRHNEHDGVSNHQPHNCLLNHIFRHRSKKTSKLRVTGLCAGNSPVTGEFPAQRTSYRENVSIWWRHHDLLWHDEIMTWTHFTHYWLIVGGIFVFRLDDPSLNKTVRWLVNRDALTLINVLPFLSTHEYHCTLIFQRHSLDSIWKFSKKFYMICKIDRAGTILNHLFSIKSLSEPIMA